MAPVVALTGFMGSGKTTVGARAAASLGWQFVDLDDVVAAEAGCSIADLFAQEGEAAFRSRECAALQSLLCSGDRGRSLLVALGGGTVTSAEAAACLRESALVIYLEVDAPEAWRRVQAGDRPLARDPEDFTALLERRRQVYEASAARTVVVGAKTPEEIAREVAAIALAWSEQTGLGRACDSPGQIGDSAGAGGQSTARGTV